MDIQILDIRNILNPSGPNSEPLISTKVNRDRISDIDPYNQHVEMDLTAGDFVSGETVVLMAGPPTLDMAINTITRNTVKPMGLVVNASLQQVKQNSRWDELGFKGSRKVPNKISNTLTLSRTRCNYNSIMYSCYRWMIAELQAEQNISNLLYGSKDALKFISYPGFAAEKTLRNGQKYIAADRHYDNLGSEFFCFPFGLLSIELDHYLNLVTAMYLENCSITTYAKTVSESPLVIEGLQIEFTELKPAFGFRFAEIQKYVFDIKGGLEKNFSALKKDMLDSNAINSTGT